MTTTILTGDCRDILPTLEAGSVQTCVTSPPYWNLRDYGHPDQIGQEATVEEYVANLLAVFRQVHRVLRDDGTLWLNLGSTYGKRKQLVPVPWLVGLALQQDGWILRRDNIWSKPNCLPESVTDRTTTAHEYVLHFSKRDSYVYDAAAIGEPFADERMGASGARSLPYSVGSGRRDTLSDGHKPGLGTSPTTGYRNKRSVWTVASQPTSDAHFATFPPKLIEPCILAGSRPGDTVLDPFGGSGTTGAVAERFGRNAILIELNPEYRKLIEQRTAQRGLALGVA